jgi:hypothetical protein
MANMYDYYAYIYVKQGTIAKDMKLLRFSEEQRLAKLRLIRHEAITLQWRTTVGKVEINKM